MPTEIFIQISLFNSTALSPNHITIIVLGARETRHRSAVAYRGFEQYPPSLQVFPFDTCNQLPLVNGFLQVTWKSFEALFRTTPQRILHQTVLFLAFNGYPAGITSFIRTGIINRQPDCPILGIRNIRSTGYILDPHPDNHL